MKEIISIVQTTKLTRHFCYFLILLYDFIEDGITLKILNLATWSKSEMQFEFSCNFYDRQKERKLHNKKMPKHVSKSVGRFESLSLLIYSGVEWVTYKEWANTVERLRECCQWRPLTVLRVAIIGNILTTFLQC